MDAHVWKSTQTEQRFNSIHGNELSHHLKTNYIESLLPFHINDVQRAMSYANTHTHTIGAHTAHSMRSIKKNNNNNNIERRMKIQHGVNNL